jgi:hypothetical protein
MYTINDILKVLKCYPLALEADAISSSLIRIRTALKYPDGSNRDVFVEQPENVLDFSHSKVTDLGATFEWLFGAGIRAVQSSRRRAFVQDVASVLGVECNEGEISSWVLSEEQLPDTVMRVAQASLRVSDPLFTQRFIKGTELQEEFAEFLDARSLAFSERVTVAAPNREVVFPFEVHGKTAKSWIQLLGSRSADAAHSSSIEAFTRWYDTRGITPEVQRITVFDDGTNVYRGSDVLRFAEVSQLIPWSDQSSIEETLRR